MGSSDCGDPPAIVIDCGSDTCKAGFAGDENPRVVFPTVVAHDGPPGRIEGRKDPFIGHEAMNHLHTSHVSRPVAGGKVVSWDDMGLIYHHVFYNELEVDPTDQPVLIVDQPLCGKDSRERCAQEMFETFSVPALYMCSGAVLALYSTGRTTGCVVDCGHGASHVVPIYEGYSLPAPATVALGVSGSDVTDSLARLLAAKNPGVWGAMTGPTAARLVREIKERLAYCKVGGDARPDATFELPDGQTITIGAEAHQCTEGLFSPAALGPDFSNAMGVVEGVVSPGLKALDVDVRKAMCGNIVLAGGTTLLPGYAERLGREVGAVMAPHNVPVSVVEQGPERLVSAWVGGSVLASLDPGKGQWIGRQEYLDEGPSVIHRKCSV